MSCDCADYRELIDSMRKYMSLGSYARNTPQKVLKEFKTLMGRANAVSRERYELGEKNE
tara:strand:+ start:588 stop:764 length:177 start_codon:yes stop_codon:yes gene_type:complete